MQTFSLLKKPATISLLTITIVVSYFTYFHRYWNPPYLFWDENYHIASAQKYLNNVFFQEQHPPLGKLLIALGEKIIHPNERNDFFITTDYGRDLPEGFSFLGYRFFPSVMGWLTAPLLFLVFFWITKNAYYSFLLNFPYLFDNAQIVHNRGAMLEGPLIFFTVLALLVFLLTHERITTKKSFLPFVFALGIAMGLAFMTKVVGLILVLLLPAILYLVRKNPKAIITSTILFSTGFLLVFVSVWQIHFALGDTINPTAGTYKASDEYKRILEEGTNGSIANFPIMMADSLYFSAQYNRGVPTLNLCKSDENGSPYFYWPFGARSISYRWNTPDGEYYQYLYLQSNPIGWGLGLLGIVLSFAYLMNVYLFGNAAQRSKHHYFILTFLALYLGYMGAVSQIGRVMYLYHYFIPLVLSYILFGIVFLELRSLGSFVLNDKRRFSVLLGLGTLTVASFLFYSPFTYYAPLNTTQFQLRNIFSLWDLQCVKCDDRKTLYFPTSE